MSQYGDNSDLFSIRYGATDAHNIRLSILVFINPLLVLLRSKAAEVSELIYMYDRGGLSG